MKNAFECCRCGHLTLVEQVGFKVVEPFACEDTTYGKIGQFIIDISLCEYVDFQTLKIQESPDSTRGTKIRDITIECYDKLTNEVEPGDHVAVTGILTLKPQTGTEKKYGSWKDDSGSLIEKLYFGFDEHILTKLHEKALWSNDFRQL